MGNYCCTNGGNDPNANKEFYDESKKGTLGTRSNKKKVRKIEDDARRGTRHRGAREREKNLQYRRAIS